MRSVNNCHGSYLYRIKNYIYYILKRVVPTKYMPIISAVGLFCYGKFEETPNEKMVNMPQLSKPDTIRTQKCRLSPLRGRC